MRSEKLLQVAAGVLFGLAGTLALRGQSNQVIFSYTDFSQAVQTGRKLYVYPLWLRGLSGAGLNTVDRRTVWTDSTNGLATLTNMQAGLYRAEFQGVWQPSTNWFTVWPTNTGTVWASNLVANAYVLAGSQIPAYSMPEADARFAPIGGGAAGSGLATTQYVNQATQDLATAVAAEIAALPVPLTNNGSDYTISGTLHGNADSADVAGSASSADTALHANTAGSSDSATVASLANSVGSAVIAAWKQDATNAATAAAQASTNGLPGTMTNIVLALATAPATNAVTAFTNGLATTNLYAAAAVSPSTRRQAAKVPPMGLMGWAYNEASTISGAQWLQSSGLAALGYNQVCIDSGWAMTNRDANGNLQPYIGDGVNGPSRWPDGLTNVVNWIAQSNGCYLGLYIRGAVSTNTWGWANGPGTWPSQAYWDGYTLGSWGIRSLKHDGVAVYPTGSVRYAVEQLCAGLDDAATALNHQPVYVLAVAIEGFNGDANPFTGPQAWMPSVANGIYEYGIPPVLNDPVHTNYASLCATRLAFLAMNTWFVQPGTFVDPEGMLSSSSCCSAGYVPDTNACRVEMGLFCLGPWPLWLNCSTAFLTSGELPIFGNPAAIAINQDAACFPGGIISSNGNQVVLSRKLANSDIALGLWNLSSNTPAIFSVALSAIPGLNANQVNVFDLFDGQITAASGTLNATVNAGGLNFYRLSLQSASFSTNFLMSGMNWTIANGLVTSVTPYVWDTNASNYLAAVGYSLTNGTVQNAVNNLAIALKASGEWTNCDVILPMVSPSPNTNNMGIDLKTATVKANFTSGLTCDATGITGNGSTTYGWLGNLRSFAVFTTNNAHLFVYCGTAAPTYNTSLIGGISADYSSSAMYIDAKAPNYLEGFMGGPSGVYIGNGVTSYDFRGPIIMSSKGQPDTFVGLRSTIADSTALTFAFIPNSLCGILAVGVGDSGAANFVAPCAANLRGLSVGGYMSQTQWAAYYAAWDAFESAIGRKVP